MPPDATRQKVHALVVGSLTASVIIGFFCGTVRYTQSLLQLGLAAIGIDVLKGVDMSTPGMSTPGILKK